MTAQDNKKAARQGGFLFVFYPFYFTEFTAPMKTGRLFAVSTIM